jgi:hypothetical protein
VHINFNGPVHVIRDINVCLGFRYGITVRKRRMFMIKVRRRADEPSVRIRLQVALGRLTMTIA